MITAHRVMGRPALLAACLLLIAFDSASAFWTTENPSPWSEGATVTDVRLTFGFNPLEGTVEILYNGQWGTICDDYFDIQDARVICRMLGYDAAEDAFQSAYFGQGSGPIWLDDLQCNGDEFTVEQCQHNGFGNENCGHHEDAGVRCTGGYGTTPAEPYVTEANCNYDQAYCSYYGYCITTWDICHYPEYYTRCQFENVDCGTTPSQSFETEGSPLTDVRLINGINPRQGTVEIRHNGQWGTICDDAFDIQDARVICRMLGYDDAEDALQSAYFGQGSGPIWLDNVQCEGYEYSIEQCQHNGFGYHDCSHSEDAGVICTSGNGTTPTPSYSTEAYNNSCSSDEVYCSYYAYCFPMYLACQYKHYYPECNFTDLQCGGNTTDHDFFTEGASTTDYSFFTEQNPSNCSDYQHTCPIGGRCIPEYWVCDNINDCPYNTDEMNCGETSTNNEIFTEQNPSNCGANEHTCPIGGMCIPDYWVCDYFNDCPNNTDEMNCGETSTNYDFFTEPNNNQCTPDEAYCTYYQYCFPMYEACNMAQYYPECNFSDLHCEFPVTDNNFYTAPNHIECAWNEAYCPYYQYCYPMADACQYMEYIPECQFENLDCEGYPSATTWNYPTEGSCQYFSCDCTGSDCRSEGCYCDAACERFYDCCYDRSYFCSLESGPGGIDSGLYYIQSIDELPIHIRRRRAAGVKERRAKRAIDDAEGNGAFPHVRPAERKDGEQEARRLPTDLLGLRKRREEARRTLREGVRARARPEQRRRRANRPQRNPARRQRDAE